MMEIDLSAHSFFHDMKPQQLSLLSKGAVMETFKVNEHVFKEDEPASKFCLIIRGKVSVEVPSPEGNPFSIQTLKAGDILGWSWMIPPHEWRFAARACETTEILIMDGTAIREESAKDFELGYELYKRLAGIFVQRLEATRQQLMTLYHAA